MKDMTVAARWFIYLSWAATFVASFLYAMQLTRGTVFASIIIASITLLAAVILTVMAVEIMILRECEDRQNAQ